MKALLCLAALSMLSCGYETAVRKEPQAIDLPSYRKLSYEHFFHTSCASRLAREIERVNSLAGLPDGPARSAQAVPSIDNYGFAADSTVSLKIEKSVANMIVPYLILMGWFTGSTSWPADSSNITRKIEKVLSPYEIDRLNAMNAAQANGFLISKLFAYRKDQDTAYGTVQRYLAEEKGRGVYGAGERIRELKKARAAYTKQNGTGTTTLEFARAYTEILEWDCRNNTPSAAR